MNGKNQTSKQEQKTALQIVWGIISLVTISVIAIALFADSRTILNHSPQCMSKSQFNVECPFCGMTRAFIEIGKGNFHQAYLLNHGSLALFLSFLVNSVIFFIYGFVSAYKTKGMRNLNKVNTEQFIYKTILK